MLSVDASDKIKTAIDLARLSANQIVKAGEGASIEIDNETVKKIEAQRVAFLDLDDHGEIAAPVTPGRAVEFDGDPVDPAHFNP